MKKLIEKFIEENKLDLSETGSALNSTCCIIAGYALYIGIDHAHTLCSILLEKLDSDTDTELERVFNYAKSKNYGEWWKSEEAKKQYKF